jgi:chromosome segregation ATPase
MAELQNEV